MNLAARTTRLITSRPSDTVQLLFAAVAAGDAEWSAAITAALPSLSPELQNIANIALAFLRDDLATLGTDVVTDAPGCRLQPQIYAHLRRVPEKAPSLFAAWLWLVQKDSTQKGASAYRTLLGDVAEAAFRALQLGADRAWLLDAEKRALLADLITAELPSTTDFIAARGMVWLLAAIDRDDADLADSAKSAIERARARFRDVAFQHDCELILGGASWPPQKNA